MTAKVCWEAIQLAWINVLSGSPDNIKVDAGSQFTSKFFRDEAKAAGIHVEVVPNEAHNKIGLLERYLTIVRDVYQKLKIDDSSMVIQY